ncbi:MAG: hypothetical protein QXV83_00635 [Candidatus Anstonellaceae archaeon]
MLKLLNSLKELKKIFLLAVIFLIFIFEGCTTQVEQECKKYSGMIKTDCIRYYAIVKQSPELCYQIPDLEIRKDCMQKSTEPKEAKKMMAQVEFAKRVEQENQTAVFTNQTENLDYLVKQCIEGQLKSKDNCLLDLARDQQDIRICDEISSEEIHRRCVVTIASMTKSASECKNLKIEADRQLCLFYVS